jgi:hypothetical protein
MEELAKQLGFTTVYAAATYGFFHWLDENASVEATAALARTMSLKDYKSEQVASALVEVFDRIYTYPLLRWRAFFRSFLFTTVVSAVFIFEVVRPRLSIFPTDGVQYLWLYFMLSLLFNIFSDYLSLFVIRPALIRSGAKPVSGLVLGALLGFAVVWIIRLIAIILVSYLEFDLGRQFPNIDLSRFEFEKHLLYDITLLAGLLVFAWLPLFALGILIARLLTPLSWIVGRTQWFLKEGKEHPLKAIGYVAAVVVFVGAVAGRWVFGVL